MAPADPSLPTASDIFVRRGELAHYELRIRADSPAGRAIVKAFDVKPLLSNDQGQAKILKDLRLEKDSMQTMTDEEVLEVARRLDRQEA